MALRFLVLLAISSAAIAACGSDDEKEKARRDSLVAAMAADDAGDDEYPSCAASHARAGGTVFVIVHLDSAAANVNRLELNVVKQDEGRPLRVRLQASTGAAECETDVGGIEFRVRDPQSHLAVLVHTATKHVSLNAKRLETGETLNARAYGSDESRNDMVWGGGTPVYGEDAERERMRARVRADLERP